MYNIQNACNGNECVSDRLSITDENMEPQNYIVVWDLFNLNLNDKKVISAITKYVQQELNNDAEHFKHIANSYYYCVDEVERALLELPFEMEVKREFVVADFVKSLGLKVKDTLTTSLLDKVLKLIDIVSFTKGCELIIFVNLKTFFAEDEIVEIYKYAVYNDINILTIEGTSCEKALLYEQVLVVDDDFEEFKL